MLIMVQAELSCCFSVLRCYDLMIICWCVAERSFVFEGVVDFVKMFERVFNVVTEHPLSVQRTACSSSCFALFCISLSFVPLKRQGPTQ